MAIKETCHKIPQISSLPISQNLVHIHQNSPRLVCSNHMQPFKLYIKKLLVCVSKEIYKHINIKIFLRGLSPIDVDDVFKAKQSIHNIGKFQSLDPSNKLL